MSVLKATPGPWKAMGYCGMWVVGCGANPRYPSAHVCQVLEDRRDTQKASEANAHLIAAAPMLYDGAIDAIKALKLLRVGLTDNAAAIEVIDAHVNELEYALAQARGGLVDPLEQVKL